MRTDKATGSDARPPVASAGEPEGTHEVNVNRLASGMPGSPLQRPPGRLGSRAP